MALRSLSLCAGIGGIDLGLAPWCRTVGYVERDAYAASVLVARMEEARLDPAPVWSDLRTFDARAWRGSVDLVTGGYPCQPFSFAGKRGGSADPRHLWPDVARILDESGAALGFFENVRGHLSLGLSDVLADLARLGFDAEWTCLRASDVGAPHRRERLFILAYSTSRLARSAWGWSTASVDCFNVGYSHSQGLEGRRLCERGRTDQGTAWPPSPADSAGWSEWITNGGPEPIVRGGANGVPYWVDRLRCLGNAVVPAQARLAFQVLSSRVIC